LADGWFNDRMPISQDAFRVTLPLARAEPAGPDWHGFRAADSLPGAAAAPEPETPQGDYAPASPGPSVELALTPSNPTQAVELLAPAGGPDAAFAALHYGADAIYLGLKKFSARAEAENFTLEELSEVIAFAHSLKPRRRVFVTVNTLLRNDELPELVETLAALEELEVDAVILQDLGVYHLARRHFPNLELHASTQLAVHNRAGAEALHRLGFKRVVLARELTFEEVHDITATAGIETEVFVHGALCYSYSGLCLFSSQTLGRSGNRGKCAYSCRDSYQIEGAPETLRDGSPVRRDPATGFPFSMKDLALPDHLPALRGAGVSCFKIEGRKKSPLYVATTTDYYRRLLDGTLDEAQRPQREADLQSVFSRPWTHLFVESHKDKEVADRDTVGHRGTPIGKVELVHGQRRASRLRFRTSRPLEKHDGLQVDLPGLGKPFGFAVDRLWVLEGKRAEPAFAAHRGAVVEVELPPDHPDLPLGAPVYCSSSQVVKHRFANERPKAGLYRVCRPVRFEIILGPASLTGTAQVALLGTPIKVERHVQGPFTVARDSTLMAQVARGAFEKLGGTELTLDSFLFYNPADLFVPVSRLNQLRRDLVQGLESAVQAARAQRVERLKAEVCEPDAQERATSPSLARRANGFCWSIKVDRAHFLDAFATEDWAGIDEVIIDLARDNPAVLVEKLDRLAELVGQDRIRLALPALTRKWEERGLLYKIEKLRAAGWRKWEAANLSAWSLLELDPTAKETGQIDLATDWSVYVLNRLAARQLLDIGVSRFALSPEDGLANIRPMLAEFGQRAVLIVYQDTPLFLAESCAYANLIGGCPGKANCRFESMEMVSSHGERVTALDYYCRTIVLNQGPFCLSPRFKDLAEAGAVSLRADFIYRKYEPEEVRDRWRAIRAGRPIAGSHAANFDRGVL
jgi:putative protease